MSTHCCCRLFSANESSRFGDLLDTLLKDMPAVSRHATLLKTLVISFWQLQSPELAGNVVIAGTEQCVSPQLFDEAAANIHRLLQQGQCQH